MDKKMRIIPEPKEGTRNVFVGRTLPVIKGSGKDNYLCGNCSAKIGENISEGEFTSIVLKCPVCKLCNDI